MTLFYAFKNKNKISEMVFKLTKKEISANRNESF